MHSSHTVESVVSNYTLVCAMVGVHSQLMDRPIELCSRHTSQVQAYRRIKADSEWESIERKVLGTQVGWSTITVVPLIATVPFDKSDSRCICIKGCMVDLSSQIPAQDGTGPELVVGTLDLNIGATLPAEELVGMRPQVRNPWRVRQAPWRGA
jgi:hypothetical protein